MTPPGIHARTDRWPRCLSHAIGIGLLLGMSNAHAAGQAPAAAPAVPVVSTWSKDEAAACEAALQTLTGIHRGGALPPATAADRTLLHAAADGLARALRDPSLTADARRESLSRVAESLADIEPTRPSAEAVRRIMLAGATWLSAADDSARQRARETISAVLELPVGDDARKTIDRGVRGYACLLVVRFPAMLPARLDSAAAEASLVPPDGLALALARSASQVESLAANAPAGAFDAAIEPLMRVLDKPGLASGTVPAVIRAVHRLADGIDDARLPLAARVCAALSIWQTQEKMEARVGEMLAPIIDSPDLPRLRPALRGEVLFVLGACLARQRDDASHTRAFDACRRLVTDLPAHARAPAAARLIAAISAGVVAKAGPGLPEKAVSRPLSAAWIAATDASLNSGLAATDPELHVSTTLAWLLAYCDADDRVDDAVLQRAADRAQSAGSRSAARQDRLATAAASLMIFSIQGARSDPKRLRPLALAADSLARKHPVFAQSPLRHETRRIAAEALIDADLHADALPIANDLDDELAKMPEQAGGENLVRNRIALARAQIKLGQGTPARASLQALTRDLDALVNPTEWQTQARWNAWATMLELWAADPAANRAEALLRIRTLRTANPDLGGASTKARIEAVEKALDRK